MARRDRPRTEGLSDVLDFLALFLCLALGLYLLVALLRPELFDA